MPLTREEFRKKLEEEKRNLRRCGCGCGESLEPRVDGERHQIDGVEVNSDCYFEKLGEEIEKHPIGCARSIRP